MMNEKLLLEFGDFIEVWWVLVVKVGNVFSW